MINFKNERRFFVSNSKNFFFKQKTFLFQTPSFFSSLFVVNFTVEVLANVFVQKSNEVLNVGLGGKANVPLQL